MMFNSLLHIAHFFSHLWCSRPIEGMIAFIEDIYHFCFPRKRVPIEQTLPLEERSPIYTLPDDIIYDIGHELLSPSDAAAFALTCTALWNIMKGKHILWRLRRVSGEEYDKNQRLRFLGYLESRFPARLLCYQCATFHHQPRIFELRCDRDKRYILNNKFAFCLPFSRVQAVLNRYQYGERYGRRAISLRKTLTPARAFLDATYNITSRIIRGELVLRIDVSAKGRVKKADKDVVGWPISVFALGNPEHLGYGWSYRRSKEQYGIPVYSSCQVCSTQSVLIFTKSPCGKYKKMRSTEWLNLGDTSTLHLHWQRITDNTARHYSSMLPISPEEFLYGDFFDHSSYSLS